MTQRGISQRDESSQNAYGCLLHIHTPVSMDFGMSWKFWSTPSLHHHPTAIARFCVATYYGTRAASS